MSTGQPTGYVVRCQQSGDLLVAGWEAARAIDCTAPIWIPLAEAKTLEGVAVYDTEDAAVIDARKVGGYVRALWVTEGDVPEQPA